MRRIIAVALLLSSCGEAPHQDAKTDAVKVALPPSEVQPAEALPEEPLVITPMIEGMHVFEVNHDGMYCDAAGKVMDDVNRRGWKYDHDGDIDGGTRQFYRRGNTTLIVDLGSTTACIVKKEKH